MVTAVELHTGKGRSSLSVNLAPYETSMEISGDARRTLEAMAKDGVLFHDGAIVLDPPRSGAKAATVAAMAKLEPGRIVYVACDPVALARDTALLGRARLHHRERRRMGSVPHDPPRRNDRHVRSRRRDRPETTASLEWDVPSQGVQLSVNSLGSKSTLTVGAASYEVFRLDAVPGLEKLPYSLKILAEALLRTEDGANITAEHVRALAQWDPKAEPDTEIQFTPARVVMQDFTGVPCIVDLATMREAVAELGGDPSVINPLAPAEMVIDHSVVIDMFGRKEALAFNTDLEYERNRERYQFLRWGQTAFDNFKVVPPGTGIVHQVNLEYLARAVMTRDVDGVTQAYPDSCVGTDSHTTMINGLGVLGWGVGGIEAEAAMLGQPVSMLIPKVVGFKLTGAIPVGATATDVVLTITEMLRKHGVVGKFVEFYGEGVGRVPLANRATIGNMSPEFGSTAAIFPIDDVTIEYLRLTGRSAEQVALVEAYCKDQGLWHDPNAADYVEPVYSEYIELDLGTVVPSIAGPKRPQDRIALTDAKAGFADVIGDYAHHENQVTRGLDESVEETFPASDPIAAEAHAGDAPMPRATFDHVTSRPSKVVPLTLADGTKTDLDHGRVVIASITSCTNTSNPSVMLAAALLARNANKLGSDLEAVGQDLHGARLTGGDRVLREGRFVARSRGARLPPRRLRLHHVHRQLRSAAPRGVGSGQRARFGGRLGPVR